MEGQQSPKNASPSSSGRSSSASPEFEFWMLRNPSFPQPHQLSADQLFSHGVLLPLHLLPQIPTPPDPPIPDPPPPDPPQPSKRWTNIFKIPTTTNNNNKDIETNNNNNSSSSKNAKKEKKKHSRKSGAGGVGTELNINIWPFSRSHSAGSTGSTRASRLAGVNRKVSSAPCSRSNSAGESKSRNNKWPSSPGRAAGIHVGRASPVWQVRPRPSRTEPPVRGGNREGAVSASAESINKQNESLTSSTASTGLTGLTGLTGKSKVLKGLNVPTCIGYRQQLSCRSEEETLLGGGAGGGDRRGVAGGGPTAAAAAAGGGGGGGKLFNLRTLFTKKVY